MPGLLLRYDLDAVWFGKRALVYVYVGFPYNCSPDKRPVMFHVQQTAVTVTGPACNSSRHMLQSRHEQADVQFMWEETQQLRASRPA